MGKQAAGKASKRRSETQAKSVDGFFARVKEAYDNVASEDVGRPSFAQDILRRNTDFSRRIIAPAPGVGDVTLSYVCPHCTCCPLEDYMWRASSVDGDGAATERRNSVVGGVQLVGSPYDWRAPNRILVIQVSASAHEASICNNIARAV